MITPVAIEELLSDLSDDELPAVLLAIAARLMRNGSSTGANVEPKGGPSKLLSVPEAARKLSVTPDWIYRRSDLPFLRRLGRTVRIDEAALEKWIHRRSRQE